jgi:hypothetical protein
MGEVMLGFYSLSNVLDYLAYGIATCIDDEVSDFPVQWVAFLKKGF